MPFDGVPNQTSDVIARLELLQEIAAKSRGSQTTFSSCLWSEVRSHPALAVLIKSLGLDGGVGQEPTDYLAAAALFGFDEWIWSTDPLAWKRDLIASKLSELRELETGQ